MTNVNDNKSQHDDLSLSQNLQNGVDLQLNVFKTLEEKNDVLDVVARQRPAKKVESKEN